MFQIEGTVNNSRVIVILNFFHLYLGPNPFSLKIKVTRGKMHLRPKFSDFQKNIKRIFAPRYQKIGESVYFHIKSKKGIVNLSQKMLFFVLLFLKSSDKKAIKRPRWGLCPWFLDKTCPTRVEAPTFSACLNMAQNQWDTVRFWPSNSY